MRFMFGLVAGLAALVGVAGTFQAAEAVDIWTSPEPAVAAQADACQARGVQLPVQPTGSAVTVQMLEGATVVTERTPVHQLTLDGSGAQVDNFCLNLAERIIDNRPYCQVGGSDNPELVYVITKYPPILTDRIQQAARQAAVWHLTNNVNLQSPDATTEGPDIDAAVLAAYNAILADLETNINPEDPPAEFLPGPLALSVLPTDAVHILPGSTLHNFTVRLTNGGQPLVGVTINVTSTFGTLNQVSGVTNAQGEVPFQLTSTTVGRATITASADVTLPYVKVYLSETAPEGEQDIGGPAELQQNLSVQAAATWRTPTNLKPEEEPGAGWLLFMPMITD